MPEAGVVAGEPPEDGASAEFRSRVVVDPAQGLPFEGGVEALAGGIVGASADRAHGLGDTQLAAQIGEFTRRVRGRPAGLGGPDRQGGRGPRMFFVPCRVRVRTCWCGRARPSVQMVRNRFSNMYSISTWLGVCTT